ncbi:hypothetical protein FPV67DRAFT_1491459 [Lyophyllum atratum]|nr:hypothetical protein FPV67DRAFT_1491459 [Lyophyllum atratum]
MSLHIPPPMLPIGSTKACSYQMFWILIFVNNAEQPFFTYADSKEPNGVSVMTHLEFRRAAQRVAHALRPKRGGADGEVVTFVALADAVLYQAITAGLIVAGLVPFPMSPRNSPAAIVNLLEKTSCRRLITTNATLKPLIEGLKSHITGTPLSEELQIEEISSLATVYPNLAHEVVDDVFERYPAPATRLRLLSFLVHRHSPHFLLSPPLHFPTQHMYHTTSYTMVFSRTFETLRASQIELCKLLVSLS